MCHFSENMCHSYGEEEKNIMLNPVSRVRELEQEVEYLRSALTSLSFYFAQVQFRICQAASAEPGEKQQCFLQELETFAFSGVNKANTLQLSYQCTEEDVLRNQVCCQKSLSSVSEECVVVRPDTQKQFVKRSTGSSEHDVLSFTESCCSSQTKLVAGDNIVKRLFNYIRSKYGRRRFKVNYLKEKKIICHWGDARARLEVAVWDILETLSASYEDEDWVRVRRLVRKDLADNLRDLFEHGLKAKRRDFCRSFLRQSGPGRVSGEGHAWELLVAYYRASSGRHLSTSPRRTLSRSYGLCIGSEAPSGKERLLVVIEELEAMRKTRGRDADSVFRGFVCAALNAHRLSAWLRRVVRCRPLLQALYEPWAYVARTHARDSLDSLARLQGLSFRLPLDPSLHNLHDEWLSLPAAPSPPSPVADHVASAKKHLPLIH